MQDFKKFYDEAEDITADVSVLVRVLDLYYDTLLYYQGGGDVGNAEGFCDWLYMINQYADQLLEEMREMLEKYVGRE